MQNIYDNILSVSSNILGMTTIQIPKTLYSCPNGHFRMNKGNRQTNVIFCILKYANQCILEACPNKEIKINYYEAEISQKQQEHNTTDHS